LANEIVAYIGENCPGKLGRLRYQLTVNNMHDTSMNASRSFYGLISYSFVCHSLGGVVVRSALTEAVMAPFLNHCYTLVTLATPHCGYLYGDNSLLTTGIWILKKWSKSVCLSQLSLTDNSDPNQCFMMNLSKQRGNILYCSRFIFIFIDVCSLLPGYRTRVFCACVIIIIGTR
jgi:hypothetical protein